MGLSLIVSHRMPSTLNLLWVSEVTSWYFESYLGFGLTQINEVWNNNTCCLSYIANTIPDDALTILWASAPAGMILTTKAGIFHPVIPSPASEEAIFEVPQDFVRSRQPFGIMSGRWKTCYFVRTNSSLGSSDAIWRQKTGSKLAQVMAWCRQATSHYLSQCWPRSLSPYGVTRLQSVDSWRHRSGSTLAQVMASHLTAPSHCIKRSGSTLARVMTSCMTAPSHYIKKIGINIDPGNDFMHDSTKPLHKKDLDQHWPR